MTGGRGQREERTPPCLARAGCCGYLEDEFETNSYQLVGSGHPTRENIVCTSIVRSIVFYYYRFIITYSRFSGAARGKNERRTFSSRFFFFCYFHSISVRRGFIYFFCALRFFVFLFIILVLQARISCVWVHVCMCECAFTSYFDEKRIYIYIQVRT